MEAHAEKPSPFFGFVVCVFVVRILIVLRNVNSCAIMSLCDGGYVFIPVCLSVR